MSDFALSQFLLVLAIIADIASFQFKSRERLLICFLISSALISAHFFFLGVAVGGFLYLLTFLRFLTAYLSGSRIWLFIFILASIATFVVNYTSLISVFALIGALASTYAAFQKHDLRLRIFMILGTLSWLVFNIIVFSPAAVLRQTLFAISNLVGLWRFYGKRSAPPLSPEAS